MGSVTWPGPVGDLTIIEGDYNGTGESQYVLGIVESGDTLLLHNVDQAQTHEFMIDDTKAFGAAWTFNNQAVFARTKSGGLFALSDISTLPLSFYQVGNAVATTSSDGMQCPSGSSPLPTCGHKDGPGSSPVSDAECSSSADGWVYNPDAAEFIYDVRGCDAVDLDPPRSICCKQ